MRLSWSIAATRSDSFSRMCATFQSRVVPSAKVAIVDRTGRRSGIGRQSMSSARSGEPSCWIRTNPVASSIRIGTPIAVARSRNSLSGWSVPAVVVVVMPRSSRSDSRMPAAAIPKAAEPMSGGMT